jgi:hypothetical protein
VAAFALVIVAFLFAVDDGDGLSLVGGQTAASYLSTFALVAAYAVVPVSPGETTLNVGSTLASQSELSLWLVMLAGGLGAIVGDSTRWLVARRSSSFVEPPLARARGNRTVQGAFDFLDRARRCCCSRAATPLASDASWTCPTGVPALVGARRGPVVGGHLGLAYLVGSALDDVPLADAAYRGSANGMSGECSGHGGAPGAAMVSTKRS